MHPREEIARWMDVIYFGMVYMADPPLNFMLSFMLEITRTPYRPKNIKPHPFADASVCYPSDTHPLIVRVRFSVCVDLLPGHVVRLRRGQRLSH